MVPPASAPASAGPYEPFLQTLLSGTAGASAGSKPPPPWLPVLCWKQERLNVVRRHTLRTPSCSTRSYAKPDGTDPKLAQLKSIVTHLLAGQSRAEQHARETAELVQRTSAGSDAALKADHARVCDVMCRDVCVRCDLM
jgi:hypothetical protein